MNGIYKLTFLISLACIANPSKINAQSYASLPPYDSAYKLVFHDEFNARYNSDTVINPNNWDIIPGYYQRSDTAPYVSGCDSGYWNKASIIKVWTDSSTRIINLDSGYLKLITRKVDTIGEVWNWPQCDTLSDSSNTVPKHLCNSSHPCAIYGSDTVSTCWTVYDLSFEYTTGNLYSRQLYRYGYFEIRFKLPPSPTPPYNYDAIGPNFWLFGANDSIKAYYSEIDIFEMCSYDHRPAIPITNEYTSNAHFQGRPGLAGSWVYNDQHQLNHGLLPDTWYKAALWWSPDFIRYYLNDSLVYSTHPYSYSSDSLSYTNIPPDSLCAMQLFIDNNCPALTFCEPFDSLFQFPYTYAIDYVRIYQRKDHCDSSVVYCNASQSTFASGLYQSLTVGGSGCVDSFVGANITGLGVDSVVLGEGFSIDTTSNAYFDVQNCNVAQSHDNHDAPLTAPNPPPAGLLRKYHYNPY